jgi:hypothetical protein
MLQYGDQCTAKVVSTPTFTKIYQLEISSPFVFLSLASG